MPALPVEAQREHQHRLCHFPTAVNIRDNGATRGTMSAGGRGVSRATTKTHPVYARAIDTASSATAATKQLLRQGTTSMRDMQCAARAATSRPSVDAQVINAATAKYMLLELELPRLLAPDLPSN